jgi:hypothetical protein
MDEGNSEHQEHLASSLVEAFGNELRLALIGNLNCQAQGLEKGTIDLWAAILLLPKREYSRVYWVRIGFCLWELRQDEMRDKKMWKRAKFLLA